MAYIFGWNEMPLVAFLYVSSSLVNYFNILLTPHDVPIARSHGVVRVCLCVCANAHTYHTSYARRACVRQLGQLAMRPCGGRRPAQKWFRSWSFLHRAPRSLCDSRTHQVRATRTHIGEGTSSSSNSGDSLTVARPPMP